MKKILGKLTIFTLTEFFVKNLFEFAGRISSKFSTAKLMALNETGIHNVVSLFLTLSMTVDMGEMVIFYC